MEPRAYRPAQPDAWLPDGTAVYGQVGVVAIDEASATVQCAMCGRWLNTVSGAHLTKRHGITVGEYRERYGLGLRTVLEAPQRRQQRRESTLERMKREPNLQRLLEQGAEQARDGRRPVETAQNVSVANSRRLERAIQLKQRGRRGSQATQLAAKQRLQSRAATLGFNDIATFLADRHAAGASTSSISAELACAWETVAALLSKLDLPGPLEPAHPVERAALAKVGYPTMREFLLAQPPGTSPTLLANQLGHSVPWLQIRARRDGLESQLKTTTARARTAIVVAEAGFSELGEYLRKRYEVDGLSVTQIRNETGLHGQELAGLLRAAGTARRDNPANAERAVLDRVGWSGSLSDYVIDRDRAGMSI